MDKRATAALKPAGSARIGDRDPRSPPSTRRNPVARAVRQLRRGIVPSKKIYNRKVLGSAPRIGC